MEGHGLSLAVCADTREREWNFLSSLRFYLICITNSSILYLKNHYLNDILLGNSS